MVKRAMLKIYYGPMFSGKSAHLIKDILNNISTSKLVFKPSQDTRSEKVFTREELVFEAQSITDPKEILIEIKDWIRTVYIDEINYFDKELVGVVRNILDLGIDVVLSGLDRDYRTDYFDSTKELIEMADIAVKLKAKCHICGNPSKWTGRFINGKPDSKDSLTIIPDSENSKIEYKTLCDKHHPFVGEKNETIFRFD